MGDTEPKKSASKRASTQKRTRNRKFQVQPGFAKRLTQLCEDSNVPKSARVAYICEETGRKKQTVYRWFQDENAGAPDLESFALLCFRFQVDANWFLGLTPTQFPLPGSGSLRKEGQEQLRGDEVAVEYLAQLESEIERIAPGHVAMIMRGDEMEPRIRNGARLIVDASVQDWSRNGIFALDYKGQRTVRIVEHRIGEGIVLSCENKQYRPTILKDPAMARKLGIKIIGEIKGWHQTTWA